MRAAPVNECPVPVMRTRRPDAAASRTARTTSSTEEGVRTSAGTTDWLPAQLRNSRMNMNDTHDFCSATGGRSHVEPATPTAAASRAQRKGKA